MKSDHKLSEAAEIDAAIAEAEAEYQHSGILLDAHDSLTTLRKKHQATKNLLAELAKGMTSL